MKTSASGPERTERFGTRRCPIGLSKNGEHRKQLGHSYSKGGGGLTTLILNKTALNTLPCPLELDLTIHLPITVTIKKEY